MTTIAIVTGIIALACVVGAIWLGVIGIWQATIPLGALALIFGYMLYRDIRKLTR